MAALNKTSNPYADCVDELRAPKAVIAAIALSLAARLSDDSLADGFRLLKDEWAALHAAGIVPQSPPK